MYEYQAAVTKVTDGDSCWVVVDVGFRMKTELPLRLYGINAPELSSKNPAEREAAQKARDYLQGLIAGQTVRVVTVKPREKFGRYLATMWLVGQGLQEQSINEIMVQRGHAVPYDGGVRVPFGP